MPKTAAQEFRNRAWMTWFAVLAVIASSFFAAVMVLPANVRAATLYVGGAGPSNYTIIRYAIENASAGDTIYVYNGTYRENVYVDKVVSLVGEDRNTTIIDGGGADIVVRVVSDWVNISGFTVTNGSSAALGAGIGLDGVRNCHLYENNVSSNGRIGIYLNLADNNTVEDNSAWNNVGTDGAGVYLGYSRNNTIVDNTLSENANGVYLYYSDDNIVTGNRVLLNWEDGISVWNSDNNQVLNNTAIDNGIGISIIFAHFNRAKDNNVTGSSWVGIRLWDSLNNTVTGNNISSSTLAAIELYHSMGNVFSSNTMADAGIFISALLQEIPEYWNTHTIDTSNTVGGRPVHYWKDVVGGTVPTGAGQVILANCTGVKVENQHLFNTTAGIEVGFSAGTMILNTTASNSKYGFYLYKADGALMDNITASADETGVYLIRTNGSWVFRSNLSGNTYDGLSMEDSFGNGAVNVTFFNNQLAGAFLLRSEANTIAGSNISMNQFAGVQLRRSGNNTIVENAIWGSWYGLRADYSFWNRIYHNNFLGSILFEANDDRVNWWNDSYPSGGNYWIDYAGIDTMCGPLQNQSGSDGIGDTPYAIIIPPSIDSYPLMYPYPFRPQFPPSAPKNLQASRGSWQVTLTWSPPDYDFGSPVTNYTVYRGLTSGMETFLVKLGNVLTHIDTGLVNGVTYYYKVAAVSVIGEGPKSSEANATPAMAPFAPTGLTAVGGNQQVTLTWVAPSWDGGSPVTNYTIYRGLTSGGETPLTTVGNVLTYVDTGLSSGETYYYEVAAINAVGESPKSGEASATTLAVPGPPTGLTAAPGNSQVTLSWSAPADNGGSPITNYRIYRGTTPGGEAFLVTIGNVLTYLDPAVTNGITYYYKVAAVNVVGQGPNSTEASATPATTPTAPLNLQATAGNGQVTLTWSAPSNNGGLPITNYRIYRGTTPGGETILVEIGNVLAYLNSGLTNGQTYYYTVSAKNALGEGPPSTEVSATPITVPGPPTGLTAAAGVGEIALTWSAPGDDGGSPITNYRIYRGTAPDGETFLLEVGNVLTHVDTGLTSGRTYYYKVRAKNAAGEGPPSGEASATPLGIPGRPTGLTATPGNGRVTLTWLAPSYGGGSPIANYMIYRGATLGGMVFLVKTGNVLTYSDTAVTNGQTYYYKVAAVNGVGHGPNSTEVMATPATTPSQPLILQAAGGNSQVALVWTAPASNGGFPVTSYVVYRGTTPGGETFFVETGSAPAYTDFAVTNGQAYYYKVSAKNVLGEGPMSGEASATPLGVPDPPTGLTAASSNAQVTLSWAAPSYDGGSPVTNYEIYRGTAPGGESLLIEVADVLTYTDTGLTNGQTYYYKVGAKNAVGEGQKSTEVSATPATTPSEPLSLQATAGDEWATLTWSVPASDGGSPITGYRIYRGTTSGGETLLAEAGDVLKYTDFTVTNGQTYYYRVTARNAAGEGPNSAEVGATPASTTLPPVKEKSIFDEGWLWLLIVLVVVLVVLLLFMLLRKLKSAKAEQPTTEEEESEEPIESEGEDELSASDSEQEVEEEEQSLS